MSRARSRAGRRSSTRPRRRRAVRGSPVSLRLGDPRRRGVRGSVVARRADAAPGLLGGRNHRESVGVAVSRRRAGHSPGDDRDPLGRQPVRDRLRECRRRARRPGLRRRRVHLPERPPAPRGRAFSRRLGSRGLRSRSHGPRARREHHLARRRDAPPRRRQARAGDRRARGRRGSRHLPLRRRRRRPSFFLPAPDPRPATRVSSSARRSSPRSAWVSAITSRRIGSRRSGSPCPVGGTACSRSSSRGATW